MLLLGGIAPASMQEQPAGRQCQIERHFFSQNHVLRSRPELAVMMEANDEERELPWVVTTHM
jgi:hypothetical protein